MHNLYVYYRVVPTAAAVAAATALLAHVEQRSGIHGRLMQRADDPATWMEVYEGVADLEDFMAALSAAEAASGIAGCLASGARRVCEHFVPVAGVS